MPTPEGFVPAVRDNPVAAVLVLYRDNLLDVEAAERAIRSAVDKERGRTGTPKDLENAIRRLSGDDSRTTAPCRI